MLVKELKKILEKIDDDVKVLISLDDKYPIEATGAEKDTYFVYDEDTFQNTEKVEKLNCLSIRGEGNLLVDADDLDGVEFVDSPMFNDFEESLDESWRGEEGDNY